MTARARRAGYFHTGHPYNCFGHGPRPLVIFQGLLYENKPLSWPMLRMYTSLYRCLDADYTCYLVTRRPGLPAGSTMGDMADEYAAMIRAEFGGPVDLIGVSTGGSIAQQFAADHPELVRRLVLHSSAYRLSEAAKAAQLRAGQLARQGNWRAANAELLRLMLPRRGPMRYAAKPLLWLASLLAGLGLGAPKDPSDFVVTVEAEDQHNFKERLAEIAAPTLVIAGDQDPFYTPELCRETAAGIPNARLILYPGMGHAASGTQFGRDLLAFLRADGVTDSSRTHALAAGVRRPDATLRADRGGTEVWRSS